jgi:cytidylate kinase
MRYKKMYLQCRNQKVVARDGGTIPVRVEKMAENSGREEDNDARYKQAVDVELEDDRGYMQLEEHQ